ncbi:MAG TPA: mycofactocin biosynthesis chaperone MftB [Acidimicrobiales bacterium]|nr:mycofactocin biosynthesis chaperone MftB [Acidimicrobiales bacterium]
MSFDSARAYRLHPQVALRPEPFGALAYHYGNRKLVFLRAPELVELVRQLDQHPSADEALAGLPAARRPAFRKALASLSGSDMITEAAHD